MEQGYFMLSVQHINRDTKNIVASASYRSDEELYSERTDEKIKFRSHVVKPESMILTPNNAPDWASDREKLWNEVDRIEKKNSKTESPRLATEVLLSIPNDLDREVQKELVKDYVQTEFVSKGMVADINIHRDDINNPHAHVLLTTRPFNEDKTWGKKVQTKTQYDENGNPILNKNGNKVRKQIRFNDINTEEIRKKWSDKLNHYAERENSLRRYDNRSFEKQGLDKIAEIPLTQQEYRLEQKEKERCKKAGVSYEPITYYAQKNEQIRRYNRGEVSQLFTDEEREKAQEEIKSFVKVANENVQIDDDSYQKVKDRYKHDVGYIEAKETLKNTFDTASTFGRKVQNDLLKNSIEQSYLQYIADKFDNDIEYRNDINSQGISNEQFINDVQNRFRNLLDDEERLISKDNKRKEIYQSARNVYHTEIEKNNIIVSQMYPTTHEQFTNDEKAFIVDEAQKGNIISANNVQYLFKEQSNIPSDILLEDSYKKASKDIFFSKQKLKQLDENSIEYFVENAFIKEKEKEIYSYKEHIDDDLIIDIGKANFDKVKDQSPNEKVQLMIKLEKYNNVPTEQVIDKHNRDREDNRNLNDNKEKRQQSENNYNNSQKSLSSKVDITQFLSFYANQIEQENQKSPKKRKKKKKDQNRGHHL
ncbi:MobA/MobL family protein [Staphylococcus gallinarum]|uniref:MobA/MobL family protein n=1 Tax=Staphylococcus gallinarum TaxID=1293 RepID=UPI000E67676B|nr:MobA/MobL family protein [Staphylococcus gallinarum]RIL19588.1 MobA/MobL family protein [Staphylococcus gallinarum]